MNLHKLAAAEEDEALYDVHADLQPIKSQYMH
jgi:hypothetical protein